MVIGHVLIIVILRSNPFSFNLVCIATIMMFAGLAAANFVAFVLSTKPFFPPADECQTDDGGKKKQ